MSVLSFLLLETEEPKGGEGRDSGECGELSADREGGGEESPAHEESPVQAAEPDLRPPERLPRRHEVLSAEGQPLHSQQEQPGVRGERPRCCSGSSGALQAADTPFISRSHPQGPGRVVSTTSGPTSPPSRSPSSIP